MKSICVFASNGLGDGFLSLTLARNLQRMGHRITLYSTPLCGLASWIPWAEVRPFMAEADMDEELRNFDQIIAVEHSRAANKGDMVRVIRGQTVVQSFEQYLKTNWGPIEPVNHTDLVIPSNYLHRKYSKRVVIHPTSGAERRNWPAEKYLKLAQKLREEGFDPVFMMSPAEAQTWTRGEDFPLAVFPHLTETAAYMYESGSFIGNDSGLGHMASLIRLPTLSLFARDSYARVWRPGWGTGIVVTPTIKLPGARLKDKYWKSLLSVRKVLKGFRELVRGSG